MNLLSHKQNKTLRPQHGGAKIGSPDSITQRRFASPQVTVLLNTFFHNINLWKFRVHVSPSKCHEANSKASPGNTWQPSDDYDRRHLNESPAVAMREIVT